VPAAALLLARGANIHDIHDIALRLAAAHGHLEMVAFLLDNGASDAHAEHDGALRQARARGHRAVVALLLKRAAA